ncbi:hypothetical protein [Azoarcus olearius]|uniref:Uncharacterized protein n=1 Tax=Azoarcus sp. (strain BH72) TaxID=418699 RepID=A1K6M8_AZOSB|nr:hypothetical protein [Azoarcus olearius]CAL94483.1 hypothetical protein predicted by Glimmer/Critica [Azoarcus olearius]
MTKKEKGAAPLQSAPQVETSGANPTTKKAIILGALCDPHGLNRFEAERIGDHCLNSTIAALRAAGCAIHSEWETVPTRFNPRGVRVLRYRCYDLNRGA